MNTNEDDILQLQLNDTFYDWYLRTNQVIEYINPINVYDVFPGVGLVESRSGNPGTVELSISTNSALYGIGTLNTGGIHDVVLTYATLSTGTVTNTSLFAFQGGANPLFKVAASDMLPPTISGNHVFTGDITFEQDLNIFGPTITLNTNGGSRDNCGIIVESTADTQTHNVLWTFDTATTAWISSENLGLKTGKAFVTDSYPKAEFPFEASQSQGQVDIQLGTTSGGIPERFSIEAQFDTANSLSFSHHYNDVLVNDILELSSSGAGGEVIVKNTITITDILNSTPFAQTPTATSVPITGSDGYLSQFVNRVTLPTGGGTVLGDFVYMNGGQAYPASPDTLAQSQSIGIVESISGGNAVIIMTGAFSGILNGLTAGSKYYLDPVTPGRVTKLDPANTNGDLDKLVFIATSATSGIIIPDFTTTGSGSITTTSSSGTQDTFKTILTTSGTSVVAEQPSDTVTFTAGANITVTGNDFTDTVTFACKIPESATNHTLLSGTGSATYAYTAVIDTFSIVGRADSGNIAGIVIAPGTIVGRIDDSNDSDNAVKGLTSTEVRNIIGLPENSSYIQTVSFETGSGVPVLVHDATSDGETLTIGAGSNITFSYSGGTLFIHGESGGGGGGGGSTDGSTILVGLERDNPVVLTELLFENDFGGANTARDQFIEFEFRDNLGGTGFVSAKPTNNYLKLYADTVSGSHTAGNTLRIQGGASISSNLKTTTGFETFILDLDQTIYVQKIIASPLSTDKNGLILSGGDDSGRNTIKILDDTRPTTGAAGVNQSTLIINAWDNVEDVNELRKSTRSLGGIHATKCVSMFADSGYDDGTVGAPSLYSYPIRMHELVVDKIICANLVAEEATKVNETINKIMGGINDTGYFIGAGSTKLEFITNDVTSESKGILFEFTDTEDGATTKNAFIFSPAKDYAAVIDPLADYRQFVVGGSLRFAEVIADTGDYTTWSPTLSHGSTSGLLCESYQTSSAQLQFDANSTGTATVGVQTNAAAASAYTYLTHTHGGTASHLRITALAEIQAASFTIKTTAGVGYKFEPANTGQNIITPGHVLYVDSLTGTIGTIKSRFIIKPFSSLDGTDPINTLYYTT